MPDKNNKNPGSLEPGFLTLAPGMNRDVTGGIPAVFAFFWMLIRLPHILLK